MPNILTNLNDFKSLCVTLELILFLSKPLQVSNHGSSECRQGCVARLEISVSLLAVFCGKNPSKPGVKKRPISELELSTARRTRKITDRRFGSLKSVGPSVIFATRTLLRRHETDLQSNEFGTREFLMFNASKLLEKFSQSHHARLNSGK